MCFDVPVKAAVHSIIGQHINHVFGINERIVYAYDLYIWIAGGGAENKPSDASESVYTYLDCHLIFLLIVYWYFSIILH